jgi:hypothetical protein
MTDSTQSTAVPLEPAHRLQHEFDSGQNQVIADLAAAMRWVAAPLLLIAILYGFAAVMGVVQSFQRPEMLVWVFFVVVATVFYFSLGIWTRRASEAFQEITTSSGHDIAHLMQALDNLRKKYSLLSLIVKLYVALVIVSLVVMLVMAITGAFKS